MLGDRTTIYNKLFNIKLKENLENNIIDNCNDNDKNKKQNITNLNNELSVFKNKVIKEKLQNKREQIEAQRIETLLKRAKLNDRKSIS